MYRFNEPPPLEIEHPDPEEQAEREYTIYIVRTLRNRMYNYAASYNRPKRFCFVVKAKDYPEHYRRWEKVLLALRIGKIKQAFQIMRTGYSDFIWEGCENNPMGF